MTRLGLGVWKLLTFCEWLHMPSGVRMRLLYRDGDEDEILKAVGMGWGRGQNHGNGVEMGRKVVPVQLSIGDTLGRRRVRTPNHRAKSEADDLP